MPPKSITALTQTHQRQFTAFMCLLLCLTLNLQWLTQVSHFYIAPQYATSQSSTTYNNTNVTAGGTLTLNSGGNTSLIGAQAAGNQVVANIGGNLTIQSLQDTSTYTSNQQSSSASANYQSGTGNKPGTYGGAVSNSNTQITSTFQSVNQQSGIIAGNGGYQVSVGGTTALTGGVIVSSQQAQEQGKNTFASQGGVTVASLTNSATVNANGQTINLGVGNSLSSSGAGVGQVHTQQSSTTQSGITGYTGTYTGTGTLNTAVVTNPVSPVTTTTPTNGANTTVASTSSTTATNTTPTLSTTNALSNTFNAGQVGANVNAQVQITQQFGQSASLAIGTYAQNQMTQANLLKAQAEKAAQSGNTELANQLIQQANQITQNWGEGGDLRVLAHTLVGGLTGGIGGAVGAATSQIAVPQLAQQIAQLDIPLELKQGLVETLALTIGAVTGGAAGAAAATNATTQNYLTHAQLQNRTQQLAACANTNNPPACRNQVIAQYIERYANNQNAISSECLVNQTRCQVQINIALYDRQELINQASGIATLLQNTSDPVQQALLQTQLQDYGRQLNAVNHAIAGGQMQADSQNWIVTSNDLTANNLNSQVWQGFANMLGVLEGAAISATQLAVLISKIPTRAVLSSEGNTVPVNAVPVIQATNSLPPPPNTYSVYPRGIGAADGSLPPNYVTVSRWVSPEEASLWMQNQGTAIPAAVPRNGTPQVYVSDAGAPRAPGATGSVRIDFAVPSAMLQTGNASNNSIIIQPTSSTPIYNVSIHVPNGVTLPPVR